MAQTKDIKARVEEVLKATIDAELTRANSPFSALEDGAPFSRGLVFSKTNPFSRGIFFSRAASEIERPDELERAVAMDPVVLGALAERLTQVKAVKDLKGTFSRNVTLSRKLNERGE